MESRKADELLAALGAAQHGVFLLSQAIDLGVTRDAVRHRVARGWAVRVAKGLYRLRDHPWTWRSEAQAALLLCGWGALLSHGTAARLHRMHAYVDHETIDVSFPEGSNQRLRIGRLHVTSWMPDAHVTSVDGFPVTTVARTFFDLAGDVDRRLRNPVGREIHARRMRRVFNDALRRRGLQLVHEAAVLAALAGRGRSGTVLVRSLLEEVGPHYEPTDSDGEDLFLELVRAFELPTPRVHVAVSDDEGFIGVVDFVFEPRVVVEIDGLSHSGPFDAAEDRRRDARLRALGYEVVRIRYWPDLVTRPRAAVGRVERAIGRSN